ncbi:hypothetical protein KKH23_06015 [Patescibacteria group bacterium]|nr:hypothetical protein [Patescibacteria group bacterium]
MTMPFDQAAEKHFTPPDTLEALVDDRNFKMHLFYKALIEQGRQMERERIITILEKEYPAISTWRCWPALKGGSKVWGF